MKLKVCKFLLLEKKIVRYLYFNKYKRDLN